MERKLRRVVCNKIDGGLCIPGFGGIHGMIGHPSQTSPQALYPQNGPWHKTCAAKYILSSFTFVSKRTPLNLRRLLDKIPLPAK